MSNDPQWPAPKLVNGALQVSPSQLALLHRCHRQWGFKYLFEREPAFEGVSAAAGKAFHAALQKRFLARSPLTPALEQQMEDEVRRSFDGVEVPMDDYRDCGRLVTAVRAYNKHHAEEPFETLAVEMPVVVELGAVMLPRAFWEKLGLIKREDGPAIGRGGVLLRIDMKAIIDRLVRWPDGTVMVADTKTSKEWKASHQVMWERAGAPKAYAHAVQWLARHEPTLGLPRKVHGFMLDHIAIRREAATLKRPRKEGKEDHEFHRLRFFYTQEQIEEWRVNALRQVRQVLMEWAEGDLSHNETSCASYYGRQCPFLDVCRESEWAKRRLVLSFDAFRPKVNSVFDEKEAAAEAIDSNE